MSTTERGPLPREGWVDVGAANPVPMPDRVAMSGKAFLATVLALSVLACVDGSADDPTLAFLTLTEASVGSVLTLFVLEVGALARVVVLRAQFLAATATLFMLCSAIGVRSPLESVLSPQSLLVFLAVARFAPWQRSPRFSRVLTVASVASVALATVAAALSPTGYAVSALVGAVVGALCLAFAWYRRPSAARARWRDGTVSSDGTLRVGDALFDPTLVPRGYVGPVVVEAPDIPTRGAYRDGAARPTAVIAGSLANVEYLLTDRYDVSLARALAVSLVCAAPALGHLLRHLAR